MVNYCMFDQRDGHRRYSYRLVSAWSRGIELDGRSLLSFSGDRHYSCGIRWTKANQTLRNRFSLSSGRGAKRLSKLLLSHRGQTAESPPSATLSWDSRLLSLLCRALLFVVTGRGDSIAAFPPKSMRSRLFFSLPTTFAETHPSHKQQQLLSF